MGCRFFRRSLRPFLFSFVSRFLCVKTGPYAAGIYELILRCFFLFDFLELVWRPGHTASCWIPFGENTFNKKYPLTINAPVWYQNIYKVFILCWTSVWKREKSLQNEIMRLDCFSTVSKKKFDIIILEWWIDWD